MNQTPLLDIQNLSVSYRQGRSVVRAVRNTSLTLNQGEAYGIIGESGSGKSTLAYAIMRHLGNGGRVDSGTMLYRDQDLLRMNAEQIRALRGNRIAMVYQQPQAALNPSIQLGEQLTEVYQSHGSASKQHARRYALEMLERVR